MSRVIAMGLVAGLLAFGCGDEGGASDTTPTPTVDEIVSFHGKLVTRSDAFDYREGEFHDDFGDAAFFGVGFYARSSKDGGPEAHTKRAQETNAYDLGVLARANGDPLWMIEALEEVFMATLGAIEYAGVTGDHAGLATIAETIAAMDTFAEGTGDYLEISAGEFALDLYGPTATTAGLALIHLQHAAFFTEDRDMHVERGKAIVAAIDAKAWDAAGKRYKFRPTEDRLFLYPNATMMAVLNRLYESTNDAAYLDRVKALYEGIQPLRKAANYYQSPYSQEYQGAKTNQYGTLSAQNYLTLALLLTYENTNEAKYLDEAILILDFVREALWDEAEGKLLHHWIDDRAASKDDPDYFCSGCNMQYLYIAHYLQHAIGWTGRSEP